MHHHLMLKNTWQLLLLPPLLSKTVQHEPEPGGMGWDGEARWFQFKLSAAFKADEPNTHCLGKQILTVEIAPPLVFQSYTEQQVLLFSFMTMVTPHKITSYPLKVRLVIDGWKEMDETKWAQHVRLMKQFLRFLPVHHARKKHLNFDLYFYWLMSHLQRLVCLAYTTESTWFYTNSEIRHSISYLIRINTLSFFLIS